MSWLDELVRKWHNEPGDEPIHKALGMSPSLYTHWVERPHRFVLGIDEVGYGAWAGPLVVGAVFAPMDWHHPALMDSKDTGSEKKRADILLQLTATSSTMRYFVHRTSPEEIDHFGLFEARNRSWRMLVGLFSEVTSDTLVVIDGNIRLSDVEHVALPSADSFIPQVMAASIVAKVYRDTEMMQLDGDYPQYGFKKNKGYGGGEGHMHTKALRKYGPCPIHRRSFKPVRDRLASSA